MDTYKNFTRSLEAFFQQYLIKERGASQQTVRAYGEAFKAYLEYNKTLDIKPQNITLRNFTRSHISSFLNWIEEEKKNSISSRRLRVMPARSRTPAHRPARSRALMAASITTPTIR